MIFPTTRTHTDVLIKGGEKKKKGEGRRRRIGSTHRRSIFHPLPDAPLAPKRKKKGKKGN